MINYLKNRYYWFKIGRKLSNFLGNQDQSKILLFGHMKSGNTWLRFLLFNYRNLLLHPNTSETLTYKELNELQKNDMEKGTSFLPKQGFPIFFRTHAIYKATYNLFNKKIFIHRNPLDTLVSSYYYSKNRDVPFWDDPIKVRKDLVDIDFFVKYKINSWIDFYYTSLKHADIVLNYSRMKHNCEEELGKLIQFLDWEVDNRLIKKSVELSSFDNIKNMGQRMGQKHGMAKGGIGYGSFKGEFTRSGKEGQFHNELKEETISLVLQKFPEFKELYSDCIG